MDIFYPTNAEVTMFSSLMARLNAALLMGDMSTITDI